MDLIDDRAGSMKISDAEDRSGRNLIFEIIAGEIGHIDLSAPHGGKLGPLLNQK